MRRTTTLALPGDEEYVLDLLIRDALLREQWFTTDERIAYYAGQQCARLDVKRHQRDGIWRCTLSQPCAWCAQLK